MWESLLIFADDTNEGIILPEVVLFSTIIENSCSADTDESSHIKKQGNFSQYNADYVTD